MWYSDSEGQIPIIDTLQTFSVDMFGHTEPTSSDNRLSFIGSFHPRPAFEIHNPPNCVEIMAKILSRSKMIAFLWNMTKIIGIVETNASNNSTQFYIQSKTKKIDLREILLFTEGAAVTTQNQTNGTTKSTFVSTRFMTSARMQFRVINNDQPGNEYAINYFTVSNGMDAIPTLLLDPITKTVTLEDLPCKQLEQLTIRMIFFKINRIDFKEIDESERMYPKVILYGVVALKNK